MEKFKIPGRNNQIYLIDIEKVQWLEFNDEKFEILINKGEKDESKIAVKEEKYPAKKTELVNALVSFLQKDDPLF